MFHQIANANFNRITNNFGTKKCQSVARERDILIDCHGAVASIRGCYMADPSSNPLRLVAASRYSANHNLVPDMHLCEPVLHEKTCYDLRLVKMSGR